MSKNLGTLPFNQKHSFYRPHKRVMAMNETTDIITGEIKHPPSRTKQSFKDECDINNILKQYKTTGMLRHINEKAAQGQYLDLPAPIEFQDALNLVIQAEQAFDSLPSKLRDRFHNDPEEFLRFSSDPANGEELVTLGLATARPQAPAKAPPEPSAQAEPNSPPKA